MRITRHLAGLVTIVLVGLAPLGTAGPAEAVRPTRTIVVKAVEPKPQVFVLKGTIAPEYRKKKIVLQRRVSLKDGWRPVRVITSTKTSRFKARIFRVESSDKTCWRVRVPRSGGFKTTKSDQRCIVRAG